MARVEKIIYFHREKEENWSLADELGIDYESDAMDRLKYLGYEIGILYEIDDLTGESRALRIVIQ